MTDIDDVVTPPPADIGKRLIAGVLDAIGLLLVVGIFVTIHIRLLGQWMPMWTIAAVAIAWNVLPVWKYGSTLGLKLVGLEIIREDGQRPDILEVAARELIGRGIIAGSYLGNFLVAVMMWVFGVGGINLPVGFALLLFGVAGLLFNVALLSQLAILLRSDRRSLADMLGRVWVVEASPAEIPATSGPPLLEDQQKAELEVDEMWAAQQDRRRRIGFIIAEIVLIAFAAGIPFVNLVRMPSIDPHMNMAKKQAAAHLGELRRKFKANPASRAPAADLIDELRFTGEHEEAEAILGEHRAARRKADDKREKMLRARFNEHHDWESAELLLQLYYDHDRVADGRRVWEEYIEHDNSPATLGSFGIWLYQQELYLDAVEVLEKAIAAELSGGDGYAYLGYTLLELDRKAEAREAFVAAIERDEALEDQLAGQLKQLDDELGPRKTKRKKRRKRR